MDGPARKVRKSLVLDTWDTESLDVQLFQEQLNNAQVSRHDNTSNHGFTHWNWVQMKVLLEIMPLLDQERMCDLYICGLGFFDANFQDDGNSKIWDLLSNAWKCIYWFCLFKEGKWKQNI